MPTLEPICLRCGMYFPPPNHVCFAINPWAANYLPIPDIDIREMIDDVNRRWDLIAWESQDREYAEQCFENEGGVIVDV